jgi:PAS domain S-box-containing protein
VEISRPVDVAGSEEIAQGVVQLVARTSGYVVLDDAAHEGDFVNEPAIRQRRSKSLLCAPLLSRGRLTAILYLENDLATHAFTTERVRLLEVLLSQAATSLENASVYQALRESEAKYRQIVETAAEGVCAVDADGVATMVNSSLAEMVGYAPEEIVGRPVAAFMVPEDWRDHEARLESRRRGISDRYERRLMHKSGRVVWTLTSAAPMFDEDGRFRGSVSMVTDVTEQKRAAEEIRRLNVGLEKKVAQRTSQLQAANERLEAFSYSVSHDLRAPLRTIEGFAQLLAEHARDRVDPKEQHYLQMIQTSAGRMGQLISDLLRLSRATRAEMAMTTLDMTALTRSVFEELHEGARDRKITLVLAALPPALGDPALMRQVLVNLLSNAVKFTAGRTEALIEVAGYTDRESVVFSVKDNGAGFDMQYAGRLFGVFQRLHRVEEFDGTGIGLAIVRQIIERHGGHVGGEGAVDRGATFFFSLPQPPVS